MNNQRILALEDQLKTAMMSSDAVVLDQLLDDDRIFQITLVKSVLSRIHGEFGGEE